MKPIIFAAMTAALVLLLSCKKYIQQQEQNAALSVMTNGYWYVSGYAQNNTNITTSFSGYLFKFDANNTVTGTMGSVSATGQWTDNIILRTITTNFPGAGAPLVNLNETWTITDSYTDSVSAYAVDTVNHTTNFLQLKKQ